MRQGISKGNSKVQKRMEPFQRRCVELLQTTESKVAQHNLPIQENLTATFSTCAKIEAISEESVR
jgi:hypothetical protein